MDEKLIGETEPLFQYIVYSGRYSRQLGIYNTDDEVSDGEVVKWDGGEYRMFDNNLYDIDEVVKDSDGDWQFREDCTWLEYLGGRYNQDYCSYCDYTNEYYLDDDIVYIEDTNRYCYREYAEENFTCVNGEWNEAGGVGDAAGGATETGTCNLLYTEYTRFKVSDGVSKILDSFYGDSTAPSFKLYHKKLWTEKIDIAEDKILFPHLLITQLNSNPTENYPLKYIYQNPTIENGKLYVEEKNVEKGSIRKVKPTPILLKLGHLSQSDIENATSIDAKSFSIEFGNTADMKKEYHKALGRIRSCQSRSHEDDLSAGMGVALTSGYHIPLVVTVGDDIQGRIMMREFYDKDKERYLLVDRLYSIDAISGNHKNIYTAIVKALIEAGNNVIVSDYSQHGTSAYSAIGGNAGVFTFKEVKQDTITTGCYAPVLWKGSEEAKTGYYHDSGTRTYIQGDLCYDVPMVGDFYHVTI